MSRNGVCYHYEAVERGWGRNKGMVARASWIMVQRHGHRKVGQYCELELVMEVMAQPDVLMGAQMGWHKSI